MRKIIYAIAVLFTVTSLFGLCAQNKKEIVGKWNYQVTQAPSGFSKGVLEVKETKDALTGEVTFTSGQSTKLQKLTMRNDTIWANVYVYGENVKIEAKISELNMTGLVDTSIGVLSLKADKVVDAKK